MLIEQERQRLEQERQRQLEQERQLELERQRAWWRLPNGSSNSSYASKSTQSTTFQWSPPTNNTPVSYNNRPTNTNQSMHSPVQYPQATAYPAQTSFPNSTPSSNTCLSDFAKKKADPTLQDFLDDIGFPNILDLLHQNQITTMRALKFCDAETLRSFGCTPIAAQVIVEEMKKTIQLVSSKQ